LINSATNENIYNINDIKKDKYYIVKYNYGANLRNMLPSKISYSMEAINRTKILMNIPQFTKVPAIENPIQLSTSDYWVKVLFIDEQDC